MIENNIIDCSDDYPGNDFYCIGVRLDSPEELNSLFDANGGSIEVHSYNNEKCEVLQMGDSEIWRYGEQYAPFYNAGKELKLKFEEWNKSDAVAVPCYMDAEFSREIPFVFIPEVLNAFEHTDKDYSQPCDARLVCLTCEYDWYESEEAFKHDYASFAVESFFPLTENDELVPRAVINGCVTYSEMLKNGLTGQEYCHFRISCQGYEFDCLTYDMLLYVWDDKAQDVYLRVPQPGDIVHGTFRMEVKIV